MKLSITRIRQKLTCTRTSAMRAIPRRGNPSFLRRRSKMLRMCRGEIAKSHSLISDSPVEHSRSFRDARHRTGIKTWPFNSEFHAGPVGLLGIEIRQRECAASFTDVSNGGGRRG